MIESDLRNWLKGVYSPSRLRWIEPARGSSTGLPDCELDLDGWVLPIELKVLRGRRDGFAPYARAVQRRYHLLAAKEKRKTAFLFALRYLVSHPNYSMGRQVVSVFLANGRHYCEKDYLWLVSKKVQKITDIKGLDEGEGLSAASIRERIDEIVGAEDFWNA